jgi:hypothetical protein
MKALRLTVLLSIILDVILFSACSILEKSSQHGFSNGYYKFKSNNVLAGKVYVNVDEAELEVFKEDNNKLENLPYHIYMKNADSLKESVRFTRKSLDIDLTTILLKYRPSVNDLPAQMITDFNMAMYAGWRHDTYLLRKSRDPLGKNKPEIIGRGYDFGIFAGPGTTAVNAFSTGNHVENEYNGMIIQYGVAGFLESKVASFGIAAGYDYLVSPDRKVWIYNQKPWFGLIIGIALN